MQHVIYISWLCLLLHATLSALLVRFGLVRCDNADVADHLKETSFDCALTSHSNRWWFFISILLCYNNNKYSRICNICCWYIYILCRHNVTEDSQNKQSSDPIAIIKQKIIQRKSQWFRWCMHSRRELAHKFNWCIFWLYVSSFIFVSFFSSFLYLFNNDGGKKIWLVAC